MGDTIEQVRQVAAETGFSGVVRVVTDGELVLEEAWGLADRAHGIPMAVDAQLALASGVKGLTALTVLRLVEDGRLELGTTARSLLGDDLPLIDDTVTVEHLLAHRSGIGDYLDEDGELDLDGYLLPVPAQDLANTEDYLAVLGGYEQKFAPGESFSYCNSGYVVLALLAERAAGLPFADLVDAHVCRRAGMTDTAFLRSDELPGRAAIGYLDGTGLRTNVFHLPVRGTGDGGLYSTAADIQSLWDALFDGRIVSAETRSAMLTARSRTERGLRYGLGLWLAGSGPVVQLEGCDTGVSFQSVHDPSTASTYVVLSNTTDGAWPIARLLDGR